MSGVDPSQHHDVGCCSVTITLTMNIALSYSTWIYSYYSTTRADNISLRSLHVTFLVRSANLPEGLCILPSVISFFFFFIFNDFSETNYLRMRWTDFRNLFTEWKHFGCRLLIWTSFLISEGTLPWQPILSKNGAKLPTPCTYRSDTPKRYGLSSCGWAQ